MMRYQNTIELLGFWEGIYNPNFKPLEFERFRKQAGLISFQMLIMILFGELVVRHSMGQVVSEE